jgi:3-hydroxyisobutyrate dehydrogenase-like beta-hydroxyacid dehydrogenase
MAQQGVPLTVWARRPEVLDRFVAAGATAAPTVTELGSSCPLVAVCVRTDDDVREVVLGDGGLFAAMAPGGSLAVHSTVAPSTVREVAEAGAARGIAVVDAPVSGGSAAAAAGTMSVIAGGDPAVVERWRPVWQTHASQISVLGDIGAGQLAKLVNNALSAAQLGLALQALGSSVELGLDRSALGEVLGGSSAASFMVGVARVMPPEGQVQAAALLRKDVDLFHQIADGPEAEALAAAAEAAVVHLERLAARV